MFLLGSSLRARLVLLVLAATLPLLLFSGVTVQRAFRLGAGVIEDAATAYAQRLATAIDGEVARAQAVTMALAELPALDQPDLTAFEDTATRALAAAKLEGALWLVERDGSVVSDTLRDPDQPPGRAQDGDLVDLVFSRGEPQTSGLHFGAVTHQPQIALHVPMMRDGAVQYDAVVALSARSLVASLLPQSLPAGWFAVIADRAGRVIARTHTGTREAGEPVAPSLAALAASKPKGFGTARSMEGTPIFVGFTRSHMGWFIGVAVPQAIVRSPGLRSVGVLTAGGALLLALSLALAWRIGQGIAEPIDALAREAARLGRSEIPDAGAARGFAEAEAAGAALHTAGRLLT
ncbi:MAG TPA: cache domain-containing protein, partial [Acetobacteraceae bacterium]|nr:cache domain-containing protein [Acetobacteraceae bacterium]